MERRNERGLLLGSTDREDVPVSLEVEVITVMDVTEALITLWTHLF